MYLESFEFASVELEHKLHNASKPSTLPFQQQEAAIKREEIPSIFVMLDKMLLKHLKEHHIFISKKCYVTSIISECIILNIK